MNENDLKGVSDAMNELRETGTLSAATLAKLSGNTDEANKALNSYTNKMLKASLSFGRLTKEVADGEGSFKSLGGVIGGLASSINAVASNFGTFGKALGGITVAAGELSKFVLAQLDVMAKNYQTLGDASAGATDGVDGLLRQFNQMGNYSLPAFTKAVKANVLGLSALGGTAANGAEQLSLVSGALTKGDTAQRFLKLGMSLDAVGDATASYLADSARYGLTQGNTTEELTKKTQNYIEEVDKIARLTGQTREAQQKEAQKSLVDARFRAKLADMAANGQAEQAEELRKYVEGLGGAAGDAARALATGIPLTKEAAQANLFTNDALRQNTMAIQDGKKATVAIAETQQAMADGTVRFGKQIMYAGDMAGGMAVQAFDTSAMLKEQNKLMATGLTREQAIEAIQKKQATASGKTTEEFTSAQMATAGAAKDLQSLGFTLAKVATPAVDAFATGLKKVTGYIDEKFGSGQKGGAGGNTVGGSVMDKVKNAVGMGGGDTGSTSSTRGIGIGRGAGAEGLKLKPGAELAGKSTDALYTVAQQVAAALGGNYKYFSGLRDRGGDSAHASGKAFDIVLDDPAGYEGALGKIKGVAGIKFAQFEKKGQKNKNGSVATGDHIHAEVSAANGAILSGPMSGYKPNLTMHGTEAIVPLNGSASSAQAATSQSPGDDMFSKKMDELIALARQNNALNAKILQQAKAG
jgi:hypothetical protein